MTLYKPNGCDRGADGHRIYLQFMYLALSSICDIEGHNAAGIGLSHMAYDQLARDGRKSMTKTIMILKIKVISQQISCSAHTWKVEFFSKLSSLYSIWWGNSMVAH
jgi:hypothetical protein